MGGHVVRVGGWRGVYRVLVETPEGQCQLRRPRGKWEDNTKCMLDLSGSGLVHKTGCCEHGNEPSIFM